MKSTTLGKVVPTWATMTGNQKTIFAIKLCVMLCTFGFVFGGVLVEGMVYPELSGGS